MYDMLKDDIPEYWEEEQQVVFNILKKKLTSVSIRVYSNFNKPFKLYTDASNIGLEVILAQVDKQKRERVIAYDARKLNQAE